MWFFHTNSERHIEKLLNGYPDGNFKPDNIITKAEVIAVLNRITQNDNNDDVAPFKDKLLSAEIGFTHICNPYCN